MPRRKSGKDAKTKSLLTDVDVKTLWQVLADALAKQSLDPDSYRGMFHENIILTESYDTNHKIVVDLANRIIVDHEVRHIDSKPIRIEMPPPKAAQICEPDTTTFRREDLKLAYDQQLLDEKLYEYILQRNGQDISLIQASQDLGATKEEIDRSIDRLCNAGRLPRPQTPAIQEQTQRCMYCSAETPLGSKFCIGCGQPLETQVGAETPSPGGQTDFGTEPPLPDHTKTDDTRTRERGLRFDLLGHFSERKIREQRSIDIWQQLHSQKSLTSGKPFERFGVGHKPITPRICPKCKHVLTSLGYCDHCRRHS